jgi:hypothetical protein
MVKTAASAPSAMIDPIATQLKIKPKNLEIRRSTIRVPLSQGGIVSEPPAQVKSARPGGRTPSRHRPDLANGHGKTICHARGLPSR